MKMPLSFLGRRAVLPAALLPAAALLAAAPAAAQCVNLTTLGAAATQNFDTLANSGTTNNLTITGWFLTETGGGIRDNEQYAFDNGGSNTGDTYSYGATGATERALGGLRSGTLIPVFGACYTNNTGATINSLAIAYHGEEWRLGTAARTDQLSFEFSLNATFLDTGTWTAAPALNFVTPVTATAGAKDGNVAPNRTAIASTISSLAIANGATFWIRWTDTDATSADDGLAVDDFSLTPNISFTPPSLTVNDVSLNEGNAGTTSFTFTVSLSAPAGPGGATFDVATADGTAIAPGDYTAKSLSGQTIPAGSSTYSFTVLVNGDTSPETNETFFVSVSNVTGATVTDGQGEGTIVNDDAAPNLTINDVALAEGNAGSTSFTFTVSLSAPAGPGGATFDIATANGTAIAPGDYAAKSLTGQTIPAGSSTYAFTVLVNGDTTPETDEGFVVNVTNITNAIGTDVQGQGTIQNDDVTRIHDVQGNGAATPIPGATVTVEGVVIGDYQGSIELSGFFVEEEDADHDADPATSEGIFVFCGGCPTAVAEGQRVRVTGVVSEFFNNTEITASTAGAVVVTNAGNNLAQVTPAPIDLPVAGNVDAFYEAFEDMKVTFADTLTVAEYFELARYGTVELYEGGRPRQYTEANPPGAAGLATHNDNLNRRRVILDDLNNLQNFALPPTVPDGQQAIYHPHANGGLSVGTQGTDFFRGGDLASGLTGVLDWSFAGLTGTDAWRIRPTSANPVVFTVANPRPAAAPVVGGAIKAASMNLLNYFTTIDTTSSSNSGPCAPGGTEDCRGADSLAELNRQRERASIVICSIDADVYGFNELENTTASATITDLLGAVNARCGGAHPYAFVNTGGTLGSDAIRVQQIYRTGVLSPVGSPLSDLNAVHNRPPTAQTFDVIDATNPAFGQRFTVIANHFKSKGCPGTGADADQGDGQGCFNATRTAQATRLLTWINSTVLPAAGDPDVLLLGDFNSYAQEDPITTLAAGGYTDLQIALLGAAAYSYLFDGQLGHLDYALSSAALTPQVTGVAAWHINADEIPLFDYSDEVKDTGESAFEEKPDGSALVPPRVVYQPGSPYRAADHDPVLVGLFRTADLSITKTDSPDPVSAGTLLTYTITVGNAGPDPASTAAWSDTLPAGTSFVSLASPGGWSCTTPAIGSGGTVSCSRATLAVGSGVFTLTVAVGPTVAAGTVISNTATVTAATGDPAAGNNSATATTTVAASADLSVTKTDSPDPVTAGNNLIYTITAASAGPSVALGATLADTLPAGTTFVSLASPGGWSCTTPAVGAGGNVSCSNVSFGAISAVFTLVVQVAPSTAAGTVISNTATFASATTDPSPGNNSATTTTTVAASADLSVTNTDSPDPVTAGANLTYAVTVANAGPSSAATVSLADTLPAGTTFVSLASPGGWSCTTPAVGAAGTVSCSATSLGVGSAGFTLVVQVGAAVANGSVISNTASVTSSTPDPATGNESGTTTTTVGAAADLSVTKTDSPDPVLPGQNITYAITVASSGPSAAAAANLTDVLPAGTTFVSLTSAAGWSCTTPAAGAGGTVSCSNASFGVGSALFTLVVQVAPAASGSISNTATVGAATADPASGNNSATAITTVTGSADLSIVKTAGTGPATAGATLSYTITVQNSGPSTAATASFTDTLPAGTTFSSLSAAAGWSCTTPATGSGGTVTCSNASFAVGTAGFTLTVLVDSATPPGSTIANTATASAATGDPDGGDLASTAAVSVIAPADLSATKVAGGSSEPGGTVEYQIVISNAGPADQGDYAGDEFTDVLPPELILTGATASSGSVLTNVGTNTVTWNGAIPAGLSVVIDIEATIDPAAAPEATIANQGMLRWDGDGDGVNEATGSTDDPGAGGGADPTVIVVGGGVPPVEVPALDLRGLAILAALLAAAAAFKLRR